MTFQSEKVIEVTNLVKHYGKTKALEDVSFEVYKGDVLGFLGPNGAGKSTTIRALLSLIKPTSGQIKLFGKDPIKDHQSVFSHIGCIVEKPDFYSYLSAEKNLQIFARLSGVEVKKNRITEIIEFVGLKGREKDKLRGFSNGMKQRLGIAQTLLHDPELIILDEPTTGLDPQGILDIRNLILQLKNEHNKTILLSSHLLSEIELIANRVVIINKGKTLVQGNVSELLNTQELVVSFTLDNVELAKQLLAATSIENEVINVNQNSLSIHVSNDNIPHINKLFCDNGLKVFSIETKRKLEDYFLQLINH
ncbi:MAG: ABC transporter ATP-binding protein [Bacteroidota bacterium]